MRTDELAIGLLRYHCAWPFDPALQNQSIYKLRLNSSHPILFHWSFLLSTQYKHRWKDLTEVHENQFVYISEPNVLLTNRKLDFWRSFLVGWYWDVLNVMIDVKRYSPQFNCHMRNFNSLRKSLRPERNSLTMASKLTQRRSTVLFGSQIMENKKIAIFPLVHVYIRSIMQWNRISSD